MAADGADRATCPAITRRRAAGPAITRRRVLTGVLAGGAAAVLGGRTPASALLQPAGLGTASGGPALPRTTRWSPRPGEVSPTVKRRATSLVEAAAAWTTAGGGALAPARRRIAAAGHEAGLVAGLGPLLGAGEAAVVQVRDAQYGGILPSAASVLVVVDQWRRRDGRVVAGGTTLDVRLRRGSSGWRVTDVFPARPGPATTSVSAAARRVLASDRIRLPHAARADVRADRISDAVLRTLLALSAEHVVDVSVLRSGHPLLVFGTSRRSDHPRGRAVDVWALDSRPLVLPGNHALAGAAMRFAVAHGAYNVGGPVRLAGPQYFSDRTHADHVHLGFRT